LKKDKDGRVHFKIIFWGPSLSGKTTSLRWIYSNVSGLSKGGFTSIEDPTGRTLYFDYTPLSASGDVIFDVYTVAGQKRHKHQRKIILQGVDGIIFVADSDPSQLDANEESMEELKELLRDRLGTEVPLVIMINKRDLPNAADKEEILEKLNIATMDIPIYETIATKGIGVKRAFQAVAREVLLRKLYNLKTMT